MKILKTTFIIALMLKLINYKERTGMIYYEINVNENGWEETLMQ